MTSEIFESADAYIEALQKEVSGLAGADEALQVARGIAASASELSYEKAPGATFRVGWPAVARAARQVAAEALASSSGRGLASVAAERAGLRAGTFPESHMCLACHSPEDESGAFFICASTEPAPDTLTGIRGSAIVATCDDEGRWSVTDCLSVDDATAPRAMACAQRDLLPMAAIEGGDVTYAPVPYDDLRAATGWGGMEADEAALSRCLAAIAENSGRDVDPSTLAPPALRERVEAALAAADGVEAGCGLETLEAAARTASSRTASCAGEPARRSR